MITTFFTKLGTTPLAVAVWQLMIKINAVVAPLASH
jgi:hypothetical protein